MEIREQPTNFIPSETWDINDPLTEPVEKARSEMNQKDPVAVIDNLMNQVKTSENGTRYAILKGENPQEYSDTDALVMFNPFANAATPNMLVRTEFIREVAKFANVRDTNGKLKPVVMLASPDKHSSKLSLDSAERALIKKGDLGPAAKELLHAVSTLNIGKVTMLGFSQGADMALAGARKAYSANLDPKAVAIGDPAGIEDRSLARLGLDMSAAGTKQLKASVKKTGLAVQEIAADTMYDIITGFAISAVKPINLLLAKGMSRNSFEAHVQTLIDEGRIDKLVVGYGSDSRIAKPSIIEPSLQSLHKNDNNQILTSIKVQGGNHTWGDQMTLLAKLYLRADA